MTNTDRTLNLQNLSRLDAIITARKLAVRDGRGYAYIVADAHGAFYVAQNKPFLRTGEVTEVRDNN